MERLERLVNLVAALLDAERPISREDLRVRVGGYAEDTDAFRRNFERDKDLLRQMGMPVVVEPLDPRRPEGLVGYRIPRDRYQLPDPGLADDELAALHLAASAVDVEGAWGRHAATTALWKLAAATGPGRGGDAEAAGTEAPALELPAGERVAVLFGAVADRQQVRFGYRGELRHVDPWRLSYRNGQWYLAGFDHTRGGSRTFRLDRLDGAPELVGEPGAFQRPAAGAAVPPPPWQLGEDEEMVAHLLVDAVQADWAVTAVGASARPERGSDGSVVLHIPVTNRQAFRNFVLGLLDHAQVLGPPELIGDLVGWLEALAVGAEPGASGLEVESGPAVEPGPAVGSGPVGSGPAVGPGPAVGSRPVAVAVGSVAGTVSPTGAAP